METWGPLLESTLPTCHSTAMQGATWKPDAYLKNQNYAILSKIHKQAIL